MENLPTNARRIEALEAAQVSDWWAGVEQLSNRTASIYLRALLLTGARREELAALTWANVDFQWRKLTIADKGDSTRTIPLTPYRPRSVDALRPLLEQIEAHILALAGVKFDAKAEPGKLRVVGG